MSGAEAVSPYQRRRLQTLIQGHPGRTVAELEALLSVYDRSRFGLVLRNLRECYVIRVDGDGRIWPT
ncbi:hypothetical protein [Streptomyces phaeochromogenes]|uniref:hypothetical protein n=1 Tax=Streptomyces phaeochromogenes TaxID=1923 RepID=UPI00371B9B2A